MQVANPQKPNRLIKFLVSCLMILDGLSVLGLGLLFFMVAGLADPPDFSIEAKEANFLRGQVVAFVAFIYFLLSIISTIYWNVRYGAWRFIMLGLGILHLPVSFLVILARSDFEDFPAFLFFIPILLDVMLCILVFFGKRRDL